VIGRIEPGVVIERFGAGVVKGAVWAGRCDWAGVARGAVWAGRCDLGRAASGVAGGANQLLQESN